MKAILRFFFLLAPFLLQNKLAAQPDIKLPFPESSITTIEGATVHYRVFPSCTDSVKSRVLLVHGFAGSTFSWRFITDTLRKTGYEVIAVDIPPFGYSEKKQFFNQSFTARASLLKDFLYQKFPGCKWHVVGHSMGGGIVQTLAIIAPEIVESVTLVDGMIYSHLGTAPVKAPWIIRSAFNRGVLLATIKPLLVNRLAVKKLLGSAYGRKPSREETMGYLIPLKKGGTSRAILKSVAGYNELFAIESGAIPVPVLAIWGDRDEWVPASSYLSTLNESKDVRIVMIKGAAHCPMETHPDEFIDNLMNFLTEVENSP